MWKAKPKGTPLRGECTPPKREGDEGYPEVALCPPALAQVRRQHVGGHCVPVELLLAELKRGAHGCCAHACRSEQIAQSNLTETACQKTEQRRITGHSPSSADPLTTSMKCSRLMYCTAQVHNACYDTEGSSTRAGDMRLEKLLLWGARTQSDAQCAVYNVEHCPVEHPVWSKAICHEAENQPIVGYDSICHLQAEERTLAPGCRAGPGARWGWAGIPAQRCTASMSVHS